VYGTRRPAGVGAWRKVFAASAFGVVADGEVARDQINLFPIFMDEGCGREYSRRKPQQAGATAAMAFLVEVARQDLLLDASRIAGRGRPASAHIDAVEFEMGLIDGHGARSSLLADSIVPGRRKTG